MTETKTDEKDPNNIQLFFGAIFGTYGVKEKINKFNKASQDAFNSSEHPNDEYRIMKNIKTEMGSLFGLAMLCKSIYPLISFLTPKQKQGKKI